MGSVGESGQESFCSRVERGSRVQPRASHCRQDTPGHDTIESERVTITHLGGEAGLDHAEPGSLEQNGERWSHCVQRGRGGCGALPRVGVTAGTVVLSSARVPGSGPEALE